VILRVFHFANSAHGSRRNRYPPAGTGEIVAAEVVHRSRHTVPNERGLIHRKRSLACKSQAAHAPLWSEEMNLHEYRNKLCNNLYTSAKHGI